MNSVRILIADDISRVRQDLHLLLTLAAGIEIVGEARNGAEAVALAEALRPDALLMDLKMPVLDGLEAARRIKAALPQCRIVFLTIHAGQSERRSALAAGADSFLEKGVDLGTLLQAVYGSTQNEERLVNR